MKRMIRRSVFLCVIAGASSLGIAQITITAGDVGTKLAVGNTIVTIGDTLTSSVNIGSPGATSWDFSGLLRHTSDTLTSVTPSSTPFISQFPGSTHVLKASLAGSFSGLPGTVAGNLYAYFRLGTSLVSPGSMGSGTISLPGIGTFPGQLSILDTPPDTMYALPFTIGSQWGATYAETTVVTVSGFPYPPSGKSYMLSYVVDAYGTMKMPDGTTHDALRIREVSQSGSAIVSYAFIAKDGATVQLTASDPASPDNGTIPVAPKSVTWASGAPASVQDADAVPVEFSLLQNYPNPFNPTTEISYQVPVASTVRLAVYDLLGREVAVLVNERKAPGSYEVKFDGSSLSSGVYIYRLQAGDPSANSGPRAESRGFVSTQKLILLK